MLILPCANAPAFLWQHWKWTALVSRSFFQLHALAWLVSVLFAHYLCQSNIWNSFQTPGFKYYSLDKFRPSVNFASPLLWWRFLLWRRSLIAGQARRQQQLLLQSLLLPPAIPGTTRRPCRWFREPPAAASATRWVCAAAAGTATGGRSRSCPRRRRCGCSTCSDTGFQNTLRSENFLRPI